MRLIPAPVPNFLLLILLLLPLVSCGQLSTNPGEVKLIADFKSDFVAPRNVAVWLPEDYGKDPEKRYAVLYMHDGQNLFSQKLAYSGKEWQVDETLTKLVQEGKIRDCLVVGIYNTKDRFNEYAPQKPFALLREIEKDSLQQEFGFDRIRSDNYLQFIVKELKPYIDAHYRTIPDRESTFVAGASMGGLISLYALVEYPEVFGGAACLSTHWPFSLAKNTPAFTQAMAAYLRRNLPTTYPTKLYFDYGTRTLDAWYKPHQQLIDSLLQQKGYNETNWLSREFEGAEHNEESWRERFAVPAVFLLGK